jgi:hypothetical protein
VSKKARREVSGSFEKREEPMEGKVSKLRCARGEDRLVNADETVVITSKEGEVANRCPRVADNTSDLKCARVFRKGWSLEVVKDRSTVGAKKRESGHHPSDSSSLMWGAERY